MPLTIPFSDDLEFIDSNILDKEEAEKKKAQEDAFFDEDPVEVVPTSKKKKVKKAQTDTDDSAPTKKVPAVVAKMQQILGAVTTKITLLPLYMDGSSEPSFTIGVRVLCRADYDWVTKKANAIRDDEEVSWVQALYDVIELSAAVATLDIGSVESPAKATPLWKAMEIVPESMAYVRDPFMPHISIRTECAEMMYELFDTNFSDASMAFIMEYKKVQAGQVSTKKPLPPETKPENPTIPQS